MKGTRRGILASISEECPFQEALDELRVTIDEKRNFFEGSPVSLDLGWREMREEEYELLMRVINEAHVKLLGVISSSAATRKLLEGHGIKVIIGALGLSKHGGNARVKATGGVRPEMTAEGAKPPEEAVPPTAASPVSDATVAVEGPAPVPDTDRTLMVRKTLRSGQRVQFEGNVVVMGDVNAGAEIEAEGDVVVLGNLRGIVHAGCKGKADAVIVALNLHAAQLRIGNLIGLVAGQKGYSNNSGVMARIHEGSVATCLYGR